MASAFARPGDDDADTILAVRCPMPGGVHRHQRRLGMLTGSTTVMAYRGLWGVSCTPWWGLGEPEGEIPSWVVKDTVPHMTATESYSTGLRKG